LELTQSPTHEEEEEEEEKKLSAQESKRKDTTIWYGDGRTNERKNVHTNEKRNTLATHTHTHTQLTREKEIKK
jgi:hypothetical protein